MFYEPYETWHQLGHFQVLGGADEVWVFAEKDVMIKIPGVLVSAPVRKVGHYQEVIVFDTKGERQRIVIPEMGPTFHTNIGRVFREADGFYLIQGQSMNHLRSMFRWSKDHFELMPLEESEEWLKKVGLASNKLPEFDPAIEKITEANGWKHLFDGKAQRFIDEGAFTWNGTRLKIKADEDAVTTLRIVSTDQDRPLKIDVVTLDPTKKRISRKEANEMSKDYWDTGHRSK